MNQYLNTQTCIICSQVIKDCPGYVHTRTESCVLTSSSYRKTGYSLVNCYYLVLFILTIAILMAACTLVAHTTCSSDDGRGFTQSGRGRKFFAHDCHSAPSFLNSWIRLCINYVPIAFVVTTESFFELRISPVDNCVSWAVSLD